MPSPTPAPRQRLPPAERRRQLIAVARELLAERGPEVGLEDVAAAAGVQRSLLYRYFPDGRPDLYRAVVKDSWDALITRMDTAPERALSDKLPRNVALFLDLAQDGDTAMAVISQARFSPDPEVQELRRQARLRWAGAIAANHLAGEPAPDAVIAAICGYLSMAEALIEEWRVHETIDRAQVEAMLARILPPLVAIAAAGA